MNINSKEIEKKSRERNAILIDCSNRNSTSLNTRASIGRKRVDTRKQSRVTQYVNERRGGGTNLFALLSFHESSFQLATVSCFPIVSYIGNFSLFLFSVFFFLSLALNTLYSELLCQR